MPKIRVLAIDRPPPSSTAPTSNHPTAPIPSSTTETPQASVSHESAHRSQESRPSNHATRLASDGCDDLEDDRAKSLEEIMRALVRVDGIRLANFIPQIIKDCEEELLEDFGVHISPLPKHHLILENENILLLCHDPTEVWMFLTEDCELARPLTLEELTYMYRTGEINVKAEWRAPGEWRDSATMRKA